MIFTSFMPLEYSMGDKRMSDKNIEWAALLSDLENNYTLSIRDMCCKLKASRGWVSTYITPNLPDKIILPSGHGKDAKTSLNWAFVASEMLGRKITEKLWYRQTDFDSLMSKSISSITRQTYCVPCEFFVTDVKAFSDEYDAYSKELADLRETASIPTNRKFISLFRLEKKRSDLWRTYLREELKDIVSAGECYTTGRSKVDRIPVELDNVVSMMDSWIAPHDIKNYGDTDEMMFRRFFNEGYYRIELGFESKEGTACRKIYYIKDGQMPKHKYVDQYVTLRYDVWLTAKSIIMKDVQSGDV